MEYKLKNYEIFNITGRGLVFTVHRDENDVEGIEVNDLVIGKDNKKYRVRGIEGFRNNFGELGKNLGLLVKENEKQKYT